MRRLLLLGLLAATGCSHGARQEALVPFSHSPEDTFLDRVLSSPRAHELGLDGRFPHTVGGRRCTFGSSIGRCRSDVELHGKVGVATLSATWMPAAELEGPRRRLELARHSWRILANRQGRIFFVSSHGFLVSQA
jgi:hypothetical protein